MNTLPRLQIDLNGILHNYRTFAAARAYADTIMAAVVKDNAYGLGARAVADILYRNGCRTFFVAHGTEGSEVRTVAPQADIYVLQGYGRDTRDHFIRSNLIPVLNTPAQISLWHQDQPNQQRPALQVETGLNRLGLTATQVATMTETERDTFGLILSHLACADDPAHPQNQEQRQAFQQIRTLFPHAQYSLAASDGFLLGKTYQFHIVRLGAVLYGLNPVPHASLHSQNVVQFSAPVLRVCSVPGGSAIGYGADYITPAPRRIATLSVGYGDGVFRSFFPKGRLWFNTPAGWIDTPVAGRISMDNLMCDITDIPPEYVKEGDWGYLIYDGWTADEMAATCGTIGYEVLSAIGHGIRAQRTYI